MTYTIVLEWDPKEIVYNVSVPALPGCYTWGRTKRQAIAHAREAIAVHIDTLTHYGDPIPEESVPADIHRVRV